MPEPLKTALEAIDGVEEIARYAREGPRFNVTDREAYLYDKGYDDALDHIRDALRLDLGQSENPLDHHGI